MNKRNWHDVSGGEMDLDAISRLYEPEQNFRISKYEYPPKTEFPGQMRSGTCFVLEGQCRYSFDEDITLGPQEVVDLPAGSYEFKVLGDEPLIIVLVWPLPSEYT